MNIIPALRNIRGCFTAGAGEEASRSTQDFKALGVRLPSLHMADFSLMSSSNSFKLCLIDLAEESRPAWQRFNISESHSYIRNPARRAILETQDNVPSPENMKTDSAYVLIWDVVSYGNLKLLVFFKVEHIPSTV